MAYGKLGTGVTTANTNLQVYQVPVECVYADINISVVNPGASDSAIEVAVAANTVPTSDEYIEKGAIIPALGGTFNHSGVLASPGERVIVKTVQAGLVVRVDGKEITKV